MNIVIVAAKRTAIGSFNGTLSKIPASMLGGCVIKDLINNTKIDPSMISEVIMGQVLTAGAGQNPGRQSAIHAGIPIETPSLTINQVCGSGLKAVHLGVQSIKNGDSEIVIAGGQENMSMSPHLVNGMRNGIKMGNSTMVDSMINDGLWDAYNHYHMGITAENIAEKYGITKLEQDTYATASQNKAEYAQKNGYFKDEIAPIKVTQKGGDVLFEQDEFIRPNITLDMVTRLKPSFKTDGTVTAGNSSGVNDGAAAIMLMREDMAHKLGLTPLLYIKECVSVGLDPKYMGLGPIHATQKALLKANWDINDIDLIEANEAFAAQSLAVVRELGVDPSRVNINGGAIALGHPIGASGCRILVSLLHAMQQRNAKKGLATLCIGGGMGISLLVERRK